MSAEKRPVVILETSRGSDWGSCLTIMPNLSRAYQSAAASRVQTLDFGRHSSINEILRCARTIKSVNPSHLVFLDHQKHPYDLFEALQHTYAKQTWPELVFHLYGDFTLYTHEWMRSETHLKNKSVRFVCASPRQRRLVSSFMKEAEQSTAVCPFPVAENEFCFVPGLRTTERKARGIAEEEFVLIYTGRMSLQKNVLKMIWDVARDAGKLNRPWRLLLAGTFDDIGEPFFGIRQREGTYLRGFEKLKSELGPELSRRIEYLGPLDKPELLRAYHAADLFISYSTHHDEDYGMSPVEALCCGTRALITDWGGFGGFAVDSESVCLLPVKLSGRGAKIEAGTLPLSRFANAETELQRQTRSKLYLDHFGVAGASRVVRKLIESPRIKFDGFTNFLATHARLVKRSREGYPMFKYGSKPDPNYIRTYRNYLSESKGSR